MATDWTGLMGGALGAAGGLMGMINQDSADDRQVRQQGKLNKLQVDSQKEMADYNNQKQEELANKLNAKWKVKQLKDAGLSIGLMYGGSGAGGATTGTGAGGSGASGASAANSAQTVSSQATGTQMGLMMAQIANTLADTAKKQAEKPQIEAQTELTKTGTELTSEKVTGERFNNAVNEAITAGEKARTTELENQRKAIENTREGAIWEAYLQSGWKGKELNDPESPIAKALSAGFEKTVQDLKNAQTDGNIKKATEAIEGFKARLAEQGLSPDTPWYGKLLSDILSKLNMNPLDWIKK